MKEVQGFPSAQRVVVLPEDNQGTTTKSGIFIPEGAEEAKPGIGTIVLVGPGDKDNPMKYLVGQIIVYSQFAGLDVKLNLAGSGEHIYKVMNQLDIMMTIREVI